MTRHFVWIALAFLMSPVYGQMYLDVYIDASSDGAGVYATGILQYSYANCPACASYRHYYQQAVQLTSPSGRTAYCNNNAGGSGQDPIDLQCPVQLDPGDDYGDYTVTYSPYASCSGMGVFLNSAFSISIRLGKSVCYFDSPNYTGASGGYCLYSRIANCPAKCCPTAIGVPWYPPNPPPPSCAPWGTTVTPWFSTDGENTAYCLSPFTQGMLTSNPGACYDTTFP
ncbi:MAG: hypothetical protein JO307_04805 [Bryobacterales bacterium]|nr:hypothetical protein [Bryobacterales bacterium]